MGFQGRRGLKRDASASGVMRNVHSHDPRNAPWELSWEYTLRMMSPTEGRVLLRRGVVAHLRRCPASPCDARLATTQNHPGQMVPFGRIAL